MAQGRASRRAQRGIALIALLTVAVLAFAYVLTSRLNAASMFVGIDRENNAKVMARAKQALMGWMAINAAGTDDNPGRLPCPEAPGNFGNPSLEGIAAASCLPPNNVGRLPWRTLGLEKPIAAAGEPLWYAVSPAWSKQGSAYNLINSDSIGQLSLNGTVNDAVALIIAPGAVLAVQAGGSCAAWSQGQTRGASPPDVRDYLECGNEAGNFVTSAPGQTFNDQVLRVAATDLMPVLEAAIQQRMQREIAPALRSVYGSPMWGTSSGNPLYPFAARFDNPHPGNADFRGEDGRYHGLLPFTSSDPGCTGPRCSTTFVDFSTGSAPSMSISGVGSLLVSSSCTISSAQAQCTGVYSSPGPATLTMSNVRARNVAMALRTLAPSTMTVEYGLVPYTGGTVPGTSATGSFNTDGSVGLVLRAQVPGLIDGLGLPLNVSFRFTADLGVLADHPLLDATDATTGWFVRNEWFRTIYYATRLRSTADGISSLGCSNTNDPNWGCLRFNASGTYNIRALLVLAGASLSNPAGRPNNALADYLEYQNCDFTGSVCDPQTLYEQRPNRTSNIALPSIHAPFNDRVVLVDWNSSLLSNQAYATTPEVRLVTLQ